MSSRNTPGVGILGSPRSLAELGASEQNLKADVTQMAAAISSTVPHQLTSGRNPAEEASTSLSLLWGAALILRKLEHFANLSLSIPKYLCQTSQQGSPRGVIADCQPYAGSVRHLNSALLATGSYVADCFYDLVLKNCDVIFFFPRKIGQHLLKLRCYT